MRKFRLWNPCYSIYYYYYYYFRKLYTLTFLSIRRENNCFVFNFPYLRSSEETNVTMMESHLFLPKRKNALTKNIQSVIERHAHDLFSLSHPLSHSSITSSSFSSHFLLLSISPLYLRPHPLFLFPS